MALSKERGDHPPYEPVLVVLDSSETALAFERGSSAARIVPIGSESLAAFAAMSEGSGARSEQAARLAAELTDGKS